MNETINMNLQKTLVQDECFDLELYRRFQAIAKEEELRTIFGHLIHAEERHVEIWTRHFPDIPSIIGVAGRIKLAILTFLARIFGDVFIRICVEAIEIHGVRKYLDVAKIVDGSPLSSDLAGVLRDELAHEEAVVAGDSRTKVTGDRVRSFLFGFNDGLVELAGTIVGLAASLKDPHVVLIAGATVVMAGSISMGAGAYAAEHAESEVAELESAKKNFLAGDEFVGDGVQSSAISSAFIVGISYIIGGAAPLLPIALGDTSFVATIISAILASALSSFLVAFLSGMQTRRRVFMNLGIVAMAVAFSYAAGLFIDYLSSIKH